MIDLDDQVAGPSIRARDWQANAPQAVYGGKPPVGRSADLERILALPRRPPPDPAQFAALVAHSRKYERPNPRCNCAEILKRHNAAPRACITRMRPAQAWAMYEMEKCNGLIGLLPVGSGKTILSVLGALAIPDTKCALLLVPPQLAAQLILDYELIREHFRVPNLLVHGRAEWSSGSYDWPLLHVYPYSLLSRKESTVILDSLAPDLVIADECHKLRHHATATTSRVIRYYEKHGDTRFAAWTGSMTDSSPRDYAHHSALALRYGSPLPIDVETIEDWCRALDPSDYPAPPGALLDLCEPGEHVAEGYQRRLVETPGVVRFEFASVDCDHVINERVPRDIPLSVLGALRHVEDFWQRPETSPGAGDEEELIDPLAVAKVSREISAGFFHYWVFPKIHGQPQRREVIDEWFAARKAYYKELRLKLKDRSEHMDSEQLCQHAAERYWGDRPQNPDADDRPLPVWKCEAWPRWRDTRKTVVHETAVRKLDDYLARDAAAWALEHRGIVWYENPAFGAWVSEIAGLPMHGGGPDAGRLIGKERGETSIVASVKSHGTGRNGLQLIFSQELITQPMASPTAYEQLFGRLLRDGQKAPLVESWLYRHTKAFRDAGDKAMARAFYVQQTTGAPQKLRLGWRIDEGA